MLPPLSPHSLQLGRPWQGRTRRMAAVAIRHALAAAAAQMGGRSLSTKAVTVLIGPASTRSTVPTLEACLGSWTPTSSFRRLMNKQEFRLIVFSRSYCDSPARKLDLHSGRRFDAVSTSRRQRGEVIGGSVNSLGTRTDREAGQGNSMPPSWQPIPVTSRRQLSHPASRATYLGAPSPLYRAPSTGRPLQRLRRSAAVAFSRSASPAAGLTSAKWSEPMRHDPARHPWRRGGQPGGVRCRARFISRHKRAWDDPSIATPPWGAGVSVGFVPFNWIHSGPC